MKKVLTLCLLMSLIWAVPRDPDFIDNGESANQPHRVLSMNRQAVLVDSSGNAYSGWTNIQNCLAFNPTLGGLQFVNRHYDPTGHLNVHQADAGMTFWVHDMEVYQAEHGNARYPTSVASTGGPHIGFPVLDPVTQTWGHMCAQWCEGGWYSSFWASAVDLSGDIGSPRSVGVELPTGDIVYVCDETTGLLPYYTMSADLQTTIASGNLASNSQLWGIDCNGGVCYVFWYDLTDLSVWYVSTTDGVTWTSAAQWALTYPTPYTNSVTHNTFPQMALTDAGDPVLVFDVGDGDDNTYPFSSKVYVSTASGATPVEVSNDGYGVWSYPTICAGGGNITVVMQCAMDTTLIDSFARHDVWTTSSIDGGSTWSAPLNLTVGVTERPGVPQCAKRVDATNGNFFYFYGVNLAEDQDPFFHIVYDPVGLDPHAWYVGLHPYGIEENVVETPSRLALDVRPNPVSRHTSISYALTNAGDVSLRIFDLLGRNVSTVEMSYKNAGVYTVNLEANELANGTYFLLLDTDAGTITRSFVVVR